MSKNATRIPIFALALLLIAMLLSGSRVAAQQIEHASFQRIWARIDMPVATLQTSRTWMWGPEAISPLLIEPYRESPGGQRVVQYFDKSRMEINDPSADRNSIWYVTNGLLALELITGRMQVGNTAYELYPAAEANVVGDPDDSNAPSYATLASVLGRSRTEPGRPIIETIARDGTIGSNNHLAQWDVSDEQWVEETQHWVAKPFWEFMNATGIVYEDGVYFPEQLFQNPFYATGYPITEAYWTHTRVRGSEQDVLVQCFQRRCLTYTPLNEPDWRVETGNIGRHYYEWRYVQIGKTPVEAPNQTGDVRLMKILANPADEPGATHEYVDITNFDIIAIQLEGWRLTDEAGTTYTFPDFKLAPGATVRIHVAEGVDSATDLYWGRTGSVWNNSHDTAYLYDSSGTLVHTLSY